MKKKLIISLIVLFIFNVISIIGISQTVGVNYAKERMLNEYKEEARTMATVWRYRSGGGFKFSNGTFYTLNNEKINDATKVWFDTWYSLKTTNAEMSIVEHTSRGWEITSTSFKDTKGISLEGTLLDDERVLNAIANKEKEVDFNGEQTIGGKNYIISYSFFYRDDNDNIPYICVLGEEINSIKKELITELRPYLMGYIILYTVVYVIFFILILIFFAEEFNEIEERKKKQKEDIERILREEKLNTYDGFIEENLK